MPTTGPTNQRDGDSDADAKHGLIATIAGKVTSFISGEHDPVIFSVTIGLSPREVYARFRKLEELPEFMDYLASVRVTGPTTSHWTAKAPVGEAAIEWDAVITEDRPGEVLAWKTVDGAPFKLEGRVTFDRAPGGGERTEVRVRMALGPGGDGRPSAALAKLMAKPQVKGDLRRFKQVVETGEVVKSDASIHAGMHPAQPSAPPQADKAVVS